MICPFCGNEDTQVKDSRPAEDGAAIRRRRLCGQCEARFTTFERVQLREITIVKRNGRRSIFDRDKLERSFEIALRKRDVDTDDVARAINEIVRKLEELCRRRCAQRKSWRIGDVFASYPRSSCLCSLRFCLSQFPRGQRF